MEKSISLSRLQKPFLHTKPLGKIFHRYHANYATWSTEIISLSYLNQYVILGKKDINIETEIIDEYAPDVIDAIIAFATFFDNEEEKRECIIKQITLYIFSYQFEL